MSAANGRMMMAWVWPALVLLARLTTAEEPRRDAHGALDASEELISESEPPMETRNGGGFLPVPVWKFVKDGANASDLGRPQFLCSDTSLSVRLGLIRHSDLHLQDRRKFPWLQQGCGGSVGTVGPWLLLKLPYTSCHVASQVSNGTRFHQLKLRYFDHLLRENMTAVVACEDPTTSTLPAVSCRSTEVAVKLPLGSRLHKVKALGKDVVDGRVQTTTTPGPLLVQISTPADKDSRFEVIYVDSAGEMSTMLAACFSAARGDGRDRQRRALQHQDQWDWLVDLRRRHRVEPRQMAADSSQYLDASDDDLSDEELDEYDEESDDYSDDDEESDDPNNTTANMTDAQTNSTIAASNTTEEMLNTSMAAKPRLGRGLSDMETSGDSDDDSEGYDSDSDSEDVFPPVGPRLWRGMEASDDPEDMEASGDSEGYDSDSEDVFPPVVPRLWRGMEASDDPEDMEEDDTFPPVAPGLEDMETSGDSEGYDSDSDSEDVLPPVGPRLWRGMEASDDPEDMEASGDSEGYDSDSDSEDVFPPVGPRLWRGMENMDASDDPEDMETSGDSEDKDSEGYDSDSDSEDVFPPVGPRLWRGMENMDASDDPEDMEASGLASMDNGSSGDGQMSEGSGKV